MAAPTLNRRPSPAAGFHQSITPGGGQVYVQTPSAAGSTATLPSAGAVPATAVWAQVYGPGATTPTFILVAPPNQEYSPASGEVIQP